MGTTTERAPAPAWPDWHPGERAVQARLGLAAYVPPSAVVDGLPSQHRLFYATRLAYLPVATLDEDGRPWASLLTASDGRPGFIESDDANNMTIHAHVYPGDPIRRNAKLGSTGLFAAVGVEGSTGRRNKFGGDFSLAREEGDNFQLDVAIKFALGLCPKYISEREVVPHAGSRPNVLYDEPHLGAEARLPDEALALIQRTDTCYLATSYAPVPEDADGTAPRVGVNHRGGRPGFVRVRRDARTLVLPNYAGNRVLNSLGNIHVTPAASLVFPDFDRGAVLHVTGAARTLYDDDARRLMPESDVLTTITVTGFSFVTDALPLRHADAHYSAYSPPVRFLAEEAAEGAKPEPEATVTLVAADALTPTLTHYTFRAPHNLSDWRPAGTVVLDLRAAFGHLAGHDDCVRTWTVSHPPAPDTPDEFGLTLRTKAGGVLTPLLAAAVRRDVPMSGLEVRAALRGVKSSVPLPAPGRHLWIAGGIGATPFMALSRYIAATPGPWDIVLLLSTAEPTVLPQLFADALAGATDIKLVLHIFTHESFAPEELILPAFIDVQVHGGRIPKDGKVFAEVDATERHVHICGPLPFVNNAMAGLENAGVDLEKVYRERFTY